MINTKEQNLLIKNYILDSIITDETSEHNKLEFLIDTFRSEYLTENELKRYGNEVKVFEQWTFGLPSAFDILYEYYEIEKQLREWDVIKEDDNQKKVDMLKSNWHNYIANRVYTLARRAKVKGV